MSAFILNVFPSLSEPTGEITGTKSEFIKLSIIFVLIFVISPTSPRSASPSFFFASIKSPSLPEIPTAETLFFWNSDTKALLIFPDKTVSTVFIVFESVTLRPFTNFGSIFWSFNASLISGPPPWTITGLIPTIFIKAISLVTDFLILLSTIAAPPNLITTVLPWNSFK